jgi:predicted nucleic acid-binding protein
MTLCDTGPLYALINRREDAHAPCRALLPTLSLPLITTWPCFTEAMYFAHEAGRWPMQKLLWNLVRTGQLQFHHPSDAETARMQELMEQYASTPMDLADASLVAAAETLDVRRIFSIDGDFHIYRWRGRQAFDVVPGPLRTQ